MCYMEINIHHDKTCITNPEKPVMKSLMNHFIFIVILGIVILFGVERSRHCKNYFHICFSLKKKNPVKI